MIEREKNIETPLIFSNPYYLRCISLASLSSGKEERYGSILVKNGDILGQGFNRAINHSAFKLERIVSQGYANHAEIEALNDALKNGFDVREGEIYVAGFFPVSGQIFFKKEYTCRRCLPHLKKI